jgi:AcrR family transcriptional regulator
MTLIATTRRRQLVDAAIAEIAESGLEQASTVKIALRAGVSRGVLTHHFTNRDDLIEAVVAEVYRLAEQELGPVVAGEPTPRAQLAAYVGGSVDFYAAYPDHMLTLSEVFIAKRRSASQRRSSDPRHTGELEAVAAILRAGQEAGEFRVFDVVTMASLIRANLDAALHEVRATRATEPLRTELLRAVELMTRA